MVKFKALKGIGVTKKVTERVTEKVTETLMENEKVFLKILSDNLYAFMRIWSAGIPI